MYFEDKNLMEKIFEELNEFQIKNNEQIAIAISGGVDSIFLSICLFQYFIYKNLDINSLHAIIIDHDLRFNSLSDAKNTEILLKNQIGYKNIAIKKWQHEKIESNIEELARNARYDLITNYCNQHNIVKVLLGHHLDDQIETFFMNLFRGSSLIGLGCMQKVKIFNNIHFLRPMLNTKKKEIINFMKKNNLSWFEDETNMEDKFTRNRIRHIIAQFNIDENESNRISQTINFIQNMNDLMYQMMNEIFHEIIEIKLNALHVDLHKFVKLHQQQKIYLIFKIFDFFEIHDKPRFNQIEGIISFINTQEDMKNRKIHLANASILIKDDIIIISKCL